MNARCGAAVLLAIGLAVTHVSAERHWLMGTWTKAGVKRTPFVGDAVHERMPPGFNRPQMTEVGTYVIETEDRRYDLQSLTAIGSDGFDLHVTIGNPVTFAIEKKTAYIKVEGHEYRLLVVKNQRK